MLKSSGAMGAATMASRLLGMVREMVYARFMADGWVASAFVMAFTIPSLFRRLLGEGALTAAFIPIFKEKEKTVGEKEMWHAANAVISGLLVLSSIITCLVLVAVASALAWGSFTYETRLMLQLLGVMFPYMILVCLAAVFMGMLNARGHFFIPAMGAAVLNVVMIASVLLLAPFFGQALSTQIFALAIGVLLAGVAQAGFQLPMLVREGFRYRWVPPRSDETVRRVVRQMLPGMVGVAAFHLNVVLIQVMAFWLDKHIIASFNYAVRLMELPQGVFGISLATFLLPTLSGLAAEKKFPEFRATLTQAMGYLAFFNLLATALLLVLAEPIIRLLFEGGKFDVASTERAAFALACLAPGLVAFSMVNILARAFYALGDTKIPMTISVACLVLNLLVAFPLIGLYRQGGLGIANTISSICNVCLLLYALKRKFRQLDLRPVRNAFLVMFAAACLAGEIAWLTSLFWETNLGHTSFSLKLGSVFVPMSLAALAYLGVTRWLKVGPTTELMNLLSQRLRALRRKG
jgi:putative peptidoglycan lipid II flippase